MSLKLLLTFSLERVFSIDFYFFCFLHSQNIYYQQPLVKIVFTCLKLNLYNTVYQKLKPKVTQTQNEWNTILPWMYGCSPRVLAVEVPSTRTMFHGCVFLHQVVGGRKTLLAVNWLCGADWEEEGWTQHVTTSILYMLYEGLSRMYI